MMEKIFTNNKQKEIANFILESKYSKLDFLSLVEVQNMAIEFSFYSAKIEGNTYTYWEAENLLKENISANKDYDDAKILKNIHNTFLSELYWIKTKKETREISKETISAIHSSLCSGTATIESENLGRIRNRKVEISGTDYTPSETRTELILKLNEVMYKQQLYENPLERAIYLHCNIAKLQLFIDGNKRTARMVESITLMNNNTTATYSIKKEDILTYKSSLIEFYEDHNYNSYVNYFLDKQMTRILKLTPTQNINKGFKL